MKKNFILLLLLFGYFTNFIPLKTFAQCGFTFSVSTTESRCMATGKMTVTTTGGSGSFNYTISGPVPQTVTSSNIITGLPPGTYTVMVTDLVTNCSVTQNNIVIPGNYQDPRFQLQAADVTCINGTNGSLTAVNIQYGRPVFVFQIVAPSTAGVGTSNTTGVFNNLPAGSYSVRMTDSCGGVQTRLAVIANYNWSISQATVTKVGCDSADVAFTVTDIKGNTNIANPAIFSNFSYGVSKAPGDTIWSASRSFRFYLAHKRSLTLIVKDGCGNRKYSYWNETAIPKVDAAVAISNKACSTFTASVTGKLNLTNAVYNLLNSSNVIVASNGSGIFNHVEYGSYCINVVDACYDTTISRCFTVNRLVPAVAAALTTSNATCSTFTASVTGQTNLFNPQYCIYNNANVLLSCNTTGVFNDLAYGTYCIKIANDPGCYDTLITRCITMNRPIPAVCAAAGISNLACSTFTASLGGSCNTNVSNPQYCIYNSSNVLISCNTTGIFDNLPYGTYCIQMQNNSACYDTTITRCFTVTRPVPSVASSVSVNRACSTFTATITGQTNLTNPNYCVYNNANVLLSCNTTGVFPGLTYGSYCIKITNDPACYDTIITRCFTVNKLIPSVSNTVKINNKNCTDFRAEIQGQSNLTSPTYCLYNSSNVQLSCNTNGRFNNIPYGSYCIKITSACYDTVITRCFTVAQPQTVFSVSSHPECDHGFAHVEMTFTTGISPFVIKIYNPGNALVRTINSTTTYNEIYDLPVLPGGLQYKFVGIDACGNKDSMYHALDGLLINKSVTATSKCPGGIFPNGYGDLNVTCTNNGGEIIPKIIKKNGLPDTVNYSSVTGDTYKFTDLGPATYIVEYTIQSWCSNKYYDTFQLKSYVYPNLGQSAVYQCANNSFNVSAVVTGGLAPFTYEILGSVPAVPSIVTPPQASPVFTINNGTDYSLVNLRAIDACGNGTINDVSVLPLANIIVNASTNCWYNNIVLSVANIPNLTYSWYKKTSPLDSILVGNSYSYQIPYLLPGDTGIYVCKAELNNGCLTRYSSFNVNGACGGIPLAVNGLDFSGTLQKEDVKLKWTTLPNFDGKEFIIERKINGNFIAIGNVKSSAGANIANTYYFNDIGVPDGLIQYRLRVIKSSGAPAFSQIVKINKNTNADIFVSPNPAHDAFNLQFGKSMSGNFSVSLITIDGKIVMSTPLRVKEGGGVVHINKPAGTVNGAYMLVIQNMETNERKVLKMLFH